MVERSDRLWSTGEGNGKPLQYFCLENPMNSMKRQNDRILNKELPRSVGTQYATDLGSSSFSILSFFLFILFMGFSRQEY